MFAEFYSVLYELLGPTVYGLLSGTLIVVTVLFVSLMPRVDGGDANP